MAVLTNTVINDTGYVQLAVGSTAQRVGATAGEVRYNNVTGNFEGYSGTGWHVLSPYNFAIASITPGAGSELTSSGLQIAKTLTSTFTINGFNFTPSTTVSLGATQITTGVTYVSPTQITVTSGTGWSAFSGTYTSITVANEFGQTATFSYNFLVGSYPVFSTATALGTSTEGTISTSVAASSAGGTIAYSAASNTNYGSSGAGLPTGLSINSSTGAITGTLLLPTGTPTQVYTLSILATDAGGGKAAKDFTLIVTTSGNPTFTSPSSGTVGTITYQPVPSITASSVNSAAASTTITTYVASDPGGAGIRYKISSGQLPPGITLDAVSGILKGTFVLAGRNPASTTYNFGVTAVDSNNNASTELQSNLTVAIPYLYRQLLTTGYCIGGYKSSTPWKNVNRLNMPTEVTYSLGDQLTIAFNYHSGATGPDKHYVFGINSSGAHSVAGTNILLFNMRTEVGSTGVTMAYSVLNNAAWGPNDGTATYAYTMGGFTGTNSNYMTKYQISTDTILSSTAASSGVTNQAEGQGTSDELYGYISLGSASGIGATLRHTYSNDTMSTYSVALHACTQQKLLWSKCGFVYGGAGATYGDSTTADASNFTKTLFATAEQYTVSKGYGTGNNGTFPGSMGEEIYIQGQDRGWGIGIYDGSQNNNAIRMIYATDLGVRVDGATSRKVTTGSSSGTGGWRD